jgi:hypothetical protein
LETSAFDEVKGSDISDCDRFWSVVFFNLRGDQQPIV